MKGGVVIALMAMLAMVLVVEQGEAAFNCEQGLSYLSPCLSYLTNGGKPSAYCCNGVRNLNESAAGDRRGACECLKAAAQGNPALREDFAAKLPNACGVHVGVPISRNVDCRKVS
ncbi:hypothetical protein L6164_031259 [Bauhinia variegata]|uniref:Uncharacterized protein n=1 Tax=Bauhinia variegata TaxID=167791 RepID=A0ACB9LEF0_BAUVA|nr:hypothetical protein L6164_031259 [Bauhinia variegata]